MARTRRDGYVMISIISERYNIHPQTLRLYEREGLLQPARTVGNTRIYGPDEIRRLEMILRLTRDLGVNLAGVEVILNLQQQMISETETDLVAWLEFIRQKLIDKRCGVNRQNALVRVHARSLQKVR
jgi:MerR family transcriptional regulator/heat shock protein HspR